MEIKQILLEIKQLQVSGRYRERLLAIQKIESLLKSVEVSSLAETEHIELQLLLSSLKRWYISPVPSNEVEQLINYDKKLVDQTKKLGNQNLYVKAVVELLWDLWKFGFYEEGIKTFSQAEINLATIEDLETKATLLNALGLIYHLKGTYDTALNYYKESLNIRIKLGNQIEPVWKAQSLNNIGELYLEKGDTKIAEEYLRKSLEILEKIDYLVHSVYYLGTMIKILLRSKNNLEAMEFLKEQKAIADQNTGNQHIVTAYQISQAMVLKSSNRMRVSPAKFNKNEVFFK